MMKAVITTKRATEVLGGLATVSTHAQSGKHGANK